MQDFLELKADGGAAEEGGGVEGSGSGGGVAVPKERQVDLRIMLPDHTPTTISIPEFSRTPDVFRALMEKLSMNNSTAKYLALFERMEHDFGALKLTEKDLILLYIKLAKKVLHFDLFLLWQIGSCSRMSSPTRSL